MRTEVFAKTYTTPPRSCVGLGSMEESSKTKFDHSSDPRFFAYYAKASLSEKTRERFERVCDWATVLLSERFGRNQSLMCSTLVVALERRLCFGLNAGIVYALLM